MAYGASPGAAGGSGDALALFYTKFIGELTALNPIVSPFDGKYSTKIETEVKGLDERWVGPANSRTYTRHTNLFADLGGVQAPAAQAIKFNKYTTRFDDPTETHDMIARMDYLMSPAGDMDRMEMARQLLQAITMKEDARFISTLLQGASMPQPDVMPTSHPYITKTIAGDSSHADLSDAMCGLNVNSNLTLASSVSGAAIEDELFKHANYLQNLGFDPAECYTVLPVQYRAKIFKEQGERVSIGYTTAGATVTHPTIGIGSAFGTAPIKHGATGLNVIAWRFLPNIGTTLDTLFSPSATAGSKYAPGSTITDTVFGLNGFLPANSGAFEMNSAGGNPDDWSNAAINVKSLFNNVRMISWHPKAVRRLILDGLKVQAEQKLDFLNAYAVVVWLQTGWGVRDPTGIVYSISAKPT